MKFKPNTRSKLRFKYALVLIALAILLTTICMPCAAQTPLPYPGKAESADTLSVRNPEAPGPGVYDNLIISSQPVTGGNTEIEASVEELSFTPPEAPDAQQAPIDTLAIISGYPHSIYSRPASWTYSDPWWHGLWINTSVYAGAFVGTLFVLECLPEDATAWNRKEIQSKPFYRRWFDNIFKRGPEWDHDKFVFNYVLHPYAGAAYFMAARTCGFNFWQSFLYSACISTIGWEFGIEACMERPSYQDLFITPCLGSLLGEGFYRLKRKIVERDYMVLGSTAIGHICAFFLDPINEFVGLLSPSSRCRYIGPGCIQSQPLLIPSPSSNGLPAFGISFTAQF